MKKKILIPVGMAAIFLCASWQEAETTVSPDRLFLADNGKSLFVTNRAGCELIKMSSDGQKMEKKVSFSSPVNAMTQDANGKLWVVCDGKTTVPCTNWMERNSLYNPKQKAELLLRIFCIIRCLKSLWGYAAVQQRTLGD